MDEHNAMIDAEETTDSALSRWSRRKQQVQQQQRVEPDSVTLEPVQTTPSVALSTKQENTLPVSQRQGDRQADYHAADADIQSTAEPQEPLLCDADMPAIESLQSDSDLSCFFNPGVSEQLRQAALHYLLRLPAFNIRDGLNDYDEDYTYFEPLGDTVTSDMRFHAKRKARLAEEEAQRLAQEQAEQEQIEQEQIEQARAEQEQIEQARAEQEQIEQVRAEQEQIEQARDSGELPVQEASDIESLDADSPDADIPNNAAIRSDLEGGNQLAARQVDKSADKQQDRQQ